MTKRLLTLFGLAVMAVTPWSHGAVVDECVKMDPANVASVQQCISRIPEITAASGQANASSNGCLAAKNTIAYSQGNRYGSSQAVIPTCQVIGDALKKQNGQYPVWYPCVDYDGSQQKLNKCIPAFFPSIRHYGHNQQREVQCQYLRNTMVNSLPAVTDNLKGAKATLSCDMINNALVANGWTMAASECLGYRQNDAGHIERCLHNAVSNMRDSNHAKPDCQAAREQYRQLLQQANSASPGNYVDPACDMMEPVIARIWNGQSEAPVAAAPAPQQPAQQPAVDTPAAVNQLPAPAAIPQPSAPQAATYDPYAQQPAAQPEAAQPQTKQSEKMQKVNEGLDTARQVMDIFKGFGKQ